MAVWDLLCGRCKIKKRNKKGNYFNWKKSRKQNKNKSIILFFFAFALSLSLSLSLSVVAQFLFLIFLSFVCLCFSLFAFLSLKSQGSDCAFLTNLRSSIPRFVWNRSTQSPPSSSTSLFNFPFFWFFFSLSTFFDFDQFFFIFYFCFWELLPGIFAFFGVDWNFSVSGFHAISSWFCNLVVFSF